MTETEQNNELILSCVGNYLTTCPNGIEPKDVEDIVSSCHVPEEYAYALLLFSMCGLDAARSPKEKLLLENYFVPMVKKLQPEDYTQNTFYQQALFGDETLGTFRLCHDRYRPYEAFVADDMEQTADGRVIPCIGYFSREFVYPAVYEKDRLWMSITPNEMNTMRSPLSRARGRVLTFGLGLGYFTCMAAQKPCVSHVTVVEISSDAIALFKQYILPLFPEGSKIEIVQADAFSYAANEMAKGHFDFVFTDLWHDVSDGLPLAEKMRKYEKNCPNAHFSYWIEKTLRCYQ